jgi:hypothetical protein
MELLAAFQTRASSTDWQRDSWTPCTLLDFTFLWGGRFLVSSCTIGWSISAFFS